jgi:hypothetical protein
LTGGGEEVSAAARAIAAEAILVRARASSFKSVYRVLVTPPPFLGGSPSSLWQERDSDRRRRQSQDSIHRKSSWPPNSATPTDRLQEVSEKLTRVQWLQ